MKVLKGLNSPIKSMSVALLMSLVACGDDGSPGVSPTSTTNNQTSGTPGTTNNGTGTTNNGTTGTNNGTPGTTNNETVVCEPSIAAEACVDTCGELDDGCGETIDCGVCPCVDGIPNSYVCGACDLGAFSCSAAETGFGACDMPIPGIDELTCDDKIAMRANKVFSI